MNRRCLLSAVAAALLAPLAPLALLAHARPARRITSYMWLRRKKTVYGTSAPGEILVRRITAVDPVLEHCAALQRRAIAEMQELSRLIDSWRSSL